MIIAVEPERASAEEMLLGRARQGDAEAFCRLAEGHETRLFRQAAALCRQAEAAEDLAAETLVEAWRSLHRFDGSCRFSTWLYAILLHRHQKLVRRNRCRPVSMAGIAPTEAAHQVRLLAETPALEPTASEAVAQKEMAAHLEAAIDQLPQAQRMVLRLRFFEGASLEEIAAVLGVPVGTVKSRLHHALIRLRKSESVMNLLRATGDT